MDGDERVRLGFGVRVCTIGNVRVFRGSSLCVRMRAGVGCRWIPRARARLLMPRARYLKNSRLLARRLPMVGIRASGVP